MKPRRTLSENQYQQSYNFWLNEEVYLQTKGNRTGWNEVKTEKLRYMREYKHLENTAYVNRKEVPVTLKKTGWEKTYITAHRKTYTKPTTHLDQNFCKVLVLLVHSQPSESINDSL